MAKLKDMLIESRKRRGVPEPDPIVEIPAPHVLAFRGDKSTKPETKEYRALTIEEIRAWGPRDGYGLFWEDLRGRACNVRRNGAVKTWKRDAKRIEVPLKFGLYEAFRADSADILAGKLLVIKGE